MGKSRNLYEAELTDAGKLARGQRMKEFMETEVYQDIQEFLLAEAKRIQTDMMQPRIFDPRETKILEGNLIEISALLKTFKFLTKKRVKVTEEIKHLLRGKWEVITYYFSHEFPQWVKTADKIEENQREEKEEAGGE